MLNIDFARAVRIDSSTVPWQASPMPGVWRKPLAREDAESGHATSIVRYDAGARFGHHRHPRGEEIFVLEGIFSDDGGDFGPGSYIRNSPGTGHAPFSEGGCVLFVKLHKFAPGDSSSVDYLVDHSGWIYGVDTKGNLRTAYGHDTPAEEIVPDVEYLLR